MGMSPDRIREECKKRKEQRERIQDRKAKRSAKLRNQQPAKKLRKVIPQSVDVIGKMVSFRPNPNSDILFGEVVKVRMDLVIPKNPEYNRHGCSMVLYLGSHCNILRSSLSNCNYGWSS